MTKIREFVRKLIGSGPSDPPEMVGDWLLNDRFGEFLEEPEPVRYGKLRKLVMADKAYNAGSSALETVEVLLDHGRYAEARRRVRQMMPDWLLSPRAHRLAAVAARQLGEGRDEAREATIARRCIEGLLTTGDGTRERPYLVTHIDDEYDVIDHFEKKLASQELVAEEGRSLDRIACQDGSEYWFDLTDVHARMDEPPRRRPLRKVRA
jgi:hypothetical protein